MLIRLSGSLTATFTPNLLTVGLSSPHAEPHVQHQMEDGENIRVHRKYVKQFQEHVQDVVCHLGGSSGPHGSSRPSYIPPCGYWSEEDKDRFFHGLSVHSRFRPDLIAEDIPGKRTTDVCVYLDILADVASKTPKTFDRSAFPRALEVSEDWIEFEETQACAMAASESTWEAHQRQRQRKAELRSKKRTLQKKREEPSEVEREDIRSKDVGAAFGELRVKREAEWEKEDYMSDLGPAHLRTIDNILREAEESPVGATSEASQEREKQGHIDSARAQNGSMNTAGLPPLTAYSITHEDTLMDGGPVGGTSDHVADVQDTAVDNPPSGTNSRADTEEPLTELGNLSPRSRRRHQKRMYMRRKRAAQSGKEICTTVTRLKPGRKTNKRLLRALSRAKQEDGVRESNAASDEEVNLDDAIFTIPMQEDQKEETIDVFEGKEETEISLGIEREEVVRQSHSPTIDELEADLAKLHPNVGGFTLPYKIKENLLNFGYDGQTLEEEGLGLFHLSRLADLMSLRLLLQDTEPDVATRISSNLIKLLHAEVVSFVTDLVHRSIALHEQERISKEHTKVWRLQKERVRVGTIHQALRMMGATKDKEGYFALLVNHLSSLYEGVEIERQAEAISTRQRSIETSDGDPDSDREDAITLGESSTDEDDGDDTSIRNSEPPVSLHREIFAPFLWHSSLDNLFPTHLMPQKNSASNATIDGVSDILNGSHVVDELAEEEELDAADVAAAKQAEEELCVEFGLRVKDEERVSEADQPQRTEQPDRTGDDAPRMASPVPRKRRRGTRYEFSQRFKSSVYVEDSE